MNKLIRGEMLSYDFIEQNGLRELCDWLQSIIKARYDMCQETECNKCALHFEGCDLNTSIYSVDRILRAVYEWREDRGELHLIKDTRDVKPVERAEWIDGYWTESDGHGECVTRYDTPAKICSHCRTAFKAELLWRHNFCPNCGADMRKEDAE